MVLGAPSEPVAGEVALTGRSTDAADALTLKIGETELTGLRATVTFVFEGHGVQTVEQNFDNRLIIGDTVIPFPARDIHDYNTAEIEIPAELVRAEMDIRMHAGGRGNPLNHDDFTVRNVGLVMADGTEVRDPAFPADYIVDLKDGCCPDPSVEPKVFEDFAFRLSENDLATWQWIWDTTTVADGDHQAVLTATGERGTVTDEASITVDNTGPEVTITAPGDSLKGSVEFAVDATDATGVADITATHRDDVWMFNNMVRFKTS